MVRPIKSLVIGRKSLVISPRLMTEDGRSSNAHHEERVERRDEQPDRRGHDRHRGSAARGQSGDRHDGLHVELVYDDLRQWVAEAEKLGEIRLISRASWQEDIGMA